MVNTLARELARALQSFRSPGQADPAQAYALQSLREAEGQEFARVSWLQLEDFLGESLMALPSHENFDAAIDNCVGFWVENILAGEHYQGYLLQWLAVLGDPALAEHAATLRAASGLDLAGALALYGHLVVMGPRTVDVWVNRRIGSLDEHRAAILAPIKGRLILGLDPTTESAGGVAPGGGMGFVARVDGAWARNLSCSRWRWSHKGHNGQVEKVPWRQATQSSTRGRPRA